MKLTFLLVVLASAALTSGAEIAGKGIPCPKGLPLCKCEAGYEMYYKINPVTSCQQCACREKFYPCYKNLMVCSCKEGEEKHYERDPITRCPTKCGCRKNDSAPKVCPKMACMCAPGYVLEYKMNPKTQCQQCGCRPNDCPRVICKCTAGYETYFTIDPKTNCSVCGCQKEDKSKLPTSPGSRNVPNKG